MNKTTVVPCAGNEVPALVFPDGSKVELVPGPLVTDPHLYRTEIERWHKAWMEYEQASPPVEA